MRKALNFLPILLIALLWITVGIANAQTPEPTAAPTPDGAATEAPSEVEEPTAAPVDGDENIVIDPDGTVTIPVDSTPVDSVPSDSYNAMLTSLTVIFVALLGTVGTIGGVGIWRVIGILLIIVEVWARVSENKQDDIEVAKWRKAYDEKMMAQAAREGTETAIQDAMSAERTKLTTKALNFTPPPPDGPAHG